LKKLLYILFFFSLLSVGGCSNIEDSISQNEAKQLVLEQHKNNIGGPSIVSIEVKNNAYYIKWENKENKESGTDKVTKDGEVKMIEAQIE
jgi:hypothetical protein